MKDTSCLSLGYFFFFVILSSVFYTSTKVAIDYRNRWLGGGLFNSLLTWCQFFLLNRGRKGQLLMCEACLCLIKLLDNFLQTGLRQFSHLSPFPFTCEWWCNFWINQQTSSCRKNSSRNSTGNSQRSEWQRHIRQSNSGFWLLIFSWSIVFTASYKTLMSPLKYSNQFVKRDRTQSSWLLCQECFFCY